MISGFIFDIKRFALHDGPGLRTTLFFKGCPLSCLGCHNPEGQHLGPELLLRPDRCNSCGDCVPACPRGAISLQSGAPLVARAACDLTGACVEACLPGALELVGRSQSVNEILDLLEEDRIYFDESQGGVTLSGGEPFAQPNFLRALLLGCQERELPVVLDTCGHVAPDTFRELVPMSGHVLFDLKVLDEKRHESFAGVHNRWILENLSWLANGCHGEDVDPMMIGNRHFCCPSLTVRIPLIPGVNDDGENLRATAEYLGGLERPPQVDILPYHRLGVEKYHRMGRDYYLSKVASPPVEAVNSAVEILRESSLEVTVRGEQNGAE